MDPSPTEAEYMNFDSIEQPAQSAAAGDEPPPSADLHLLHHKGIDALGGSHPPPPPLRLSSPFPGGGARTVLSDADRISLAQCQQSLAASVATLCKRKARLQEEVEKLRRGEIVRLDAAVSTLGVPHLATTTVAGRPDADDSKVTTRTIASQRQPQATPTKSGKNVDEFLSVLSPEFRKVLSDEVERETTLDSIAMEEAAAMAQEHQLASLVFAICASKTEAVHQQRVEELHAAVWKAERRVRQQHHVEDQQRTSTSSLITPFTHAASPGRELQSRNGQSAQARQQQRRREELSFLQEMDQGMANFQAGIVSEVARRGVAQSFSDRGFDGVVSSAGDHSAFYTPSRINSTHPSPPSSISLSQPLKDDVNSHLPLNWT